MRFLGVRMKQFDAVAMQLLGINPLVIDAQVTDASNVSICQYHNNYQLKKYIKIAKSKAKTSWLLIQLVATSYSLEIDYDFYKRSTLGWVAMHCLIIDDIVYRLIWLRWLHVFTICIQNFLCIRYYALCSKILCKIFSYAKLFQLIVSRSLIL